jgi:tetratricopeptide (TPR) repeat protein
MKKALIFLISISFILFSCKTVKVETDQQKVSKTKQLTQEEAIQNTAFFIDANREKILGNLDKALSLLAQCIKKNPEYDAAMYEMAMILNQKKQYTEALVLAKKAVKIDTENKWYKLLLGDIYEKKSDYENAIKVFSDLMNKYPASIEYYYEVANLYLVLGNYNEALKTYDLLEKQIGVEEDVILQKQKIYLQLKKVNKAIEEIEKLIKVSPKEPKYYEILAELYLIKEQPAKAFEVYQKILEIAPEDPYVHLSLADYYRSQNLNEKSFEELKIAFTSRSLDVDTKIKILLSLYNAPDSQKDLKTLSDSLVVMLVKTHPDEAKAHSIYADFLYKSKRIKEARDAFRMVNKFDSSKYVIWEQLVLLDSEINDISGMEADSKKGLELFPEQAVLYFYNGFANYKLKNFQEAISVLKKGSALTFDNSLIGKFYTYLGESYFKTNNFKECYESFDYVLKIDPQNTYVLNNYSYFLSLKNQDVELAEKMAKKLNEISPGNSAYQDTYAWALFKQKKYGEAKIWAEKSINNGGSANSTILEHYGDILFKNGEVSKAIEYWQKAKSLGSESQLLERKINDKVYYE